MRNLPLSDPAYTELICILGKYIYLKKKHHEKNEKCKYVLPIFWFLKEGLIDEKRGDRAIKEEGGRQLAGHNNGLGAGAGTASPRLPG